MSDTLDRIDSVLAKQERVARLMLWALGLILTGAVWATLLQADVNALKSDNADMKPKVNSHSEAIANIEGRLHGIASQVGKVPSRVAAKLNEPPRTE